MAVQVQEALSTTDTRLSEAGVDQLVAALAQNLPQGGGLGLDASSSGPLFAIGRNVIEAQDVQLAASALSPAQLAVMRSMQQSQASAISSQH